MRYFVLLFLLFNTAYLQAKAPFIDYEVVKIRPHDPSSFTQGLEFYEGYLYEGTGLRGRSALYKINITTGKPLNRYFLAKRFFGEGITLWKGKLFQLTWTSGQAIVYDAASFKPEGIFKYEGEGWGLTHNENHLIMSNGSDTLYFRNPQNFDINHTIKVTDGDEPVKLLNELEWIKGKIWSNVWQTNKIAIINPQTGKIEKWLNLTALMDKAVKKAGRQPINVLNGIAYVPSRDTVIVTGKLWPLLFEIKPIDKVVAP
ncbi:MAG: glutaminyl-peptide cyclotransferase [Verrucomicrobiota bacterium]